MPPLLTDISALSPALLALNNTFAQELSYLTPEKAQELVRNAFMAVRAGEADGLLIAFDQDAAYDNANFFWFKRRFPRFVYVDRVVVTPAARGQGLARTLYQALFRRSAAYERVVCEVNRDPPNPASDAFHAALGFEPVGGATLPGKTVRYFSHALTPADIGPAKSAVLLWPDLP